MKSTEWLQGYFELSLVLGYVNFSPKQIEVVRRHVALVREVEGKLEDFMAFMDATLEILRRKEDTCDSATLAAIQDKLAAEFKHVIDVSYGGDQIKLNAIHGKPPKGKRPPRPPRPHSHSSDDTVYRC